MSILIDLHSHSTLSPDGRDTPMKMAERACEMGLKHFALTDHIEADKFDEWDYAGAVKKSYGEYLEIKERFGDKMEIYYGAELGQALYNLPLTEKIFAENDFDFILGSQHRTRSFKYLGVSPEEGKLLLKEYFDEVLALAEWGRFCSLSHLTYPLRYIEVDWRSENLPRICRVDMSPYRTVIDKILETIISKDIALEVNTAGIRKGLGESIPNADYIGRYKELGGKMVTVGSDAHRTADIAADIPQCLEMLKENGFDEICAFRRKQPVFIKI